MSALTLPPDARLLPQELQEYLEVYELDESVVPEDLRDLVPWAQFWSNGDDVGRARVMEWFSFGDLKAFVDALWPRRDGIRAWYEEAMRTLLPQHEVEACAFSRLWEALYEAHPTIYPQPISPPVPLSPAEAAERDAVLRSLTDLMQGGPEALLKMASDNALREDSPPEVQQRFIELARDLDKSAKEFRDQKPGDKSIGGGDDIDRKS
jgi:hypothetical protein